MTKTIGAFVFPSVWQNWVEEQAQETLKLLADMGVNTICTESTEYRDDLIEVCHRLGLKFFGGISCFSDHAHQQQIVYDRPELWPIGEDGQRRPQMEWYLGVTPTYEDYNEALLQLAEKIVQSHDLDGLFLDFIRWPVHWELEMRPGAMRPLQYSFDANTLALFSTETGILLPRHLTETKDIARWILDNHQLDWVNFKCRTITRLVARFAERLRAIRREAFTLGLYSLPMPENDLEAIAGQRLRDLAGYVDLIAPMAYHAIVHQPPSWVEQVVSTATHAAYGQVIPVLQVDSSEGAEMGADWGPPISTDELDGLLDRVLNMPGLQGLVSFTGTALFRDGRGELLKKRLKLCGWSG